MAVREIARRLINGVWTTVDVEEDGGNGSLPQAVQVIGPFPVAYNTPGLTNSYVLLHTFTARSLVIGAVLVITTLWHSTTDPIAIEVTVNPDSSNDLLWSQADIGDVPAGTQSPWPVATTPNRGMNILDIGGKLAVDAFGVTGMNAGEADIYAVVSALS